ncbi:uncharacterized protein LOC142825635 [Pelodiscus sinensis]|uniref:uncharacterized protein LOC142825635 n=1 Tax=Pelodiscus sinensis TaxID=13735 RepID=UPI003F6D955D
MVSKETSPRLARSSDGHQEQARTVRSVLLNRDSPSSEPRPRRLRLRPQQVRFKDLVDGALPEPAATPDTSTPCASPPPSDSPERLANCASDTQRCWPQARPITECLSTAIQTSPSLQKQLPAPRFCSKSPRALAQEPGRSEAHRTCARASRELASLCAHNLLPTSPLAPHTSREGQPGPKPNATSCHGLPPCPPYPGPIRCTAANYTSQRPGCAPGPSSSQPPLPPRNCGSPTDGPGPLRPPSVPCGPPGPPAEPRPLSRSQSEQALPSQPAPTSQQHLVLAGSLGLSPPAPGPSQQRSWCSSSCLPSHHSPSTVLPPPSQASSTATQLEKTSASLNHQAPSSRQAKPGAAGPSGCSRLMATQTRHGRMGLEEPPPPISTSSLRPPPTTQQLTRTPGAPWSSEPLGEPCLTAKQQETLHQVQDLLQLVAAAKGQVGLSKGDEHFLASQGHVGVRPREMGDLQSQLQSLEGVLETSQQTIKVLLDVIQDLEKKEAQRDGRRSYRTGQDIANCGTCRDCACIIYSVEHDFRQQEGRFQRVLSSIEGESRQSSPTTARATMPSRQELSPVPKLLAKLDSKKSRRKCFWFL